MILLVRWVRLSGCRPNEALRLFEHRALSAWNASEKITINRLQSGAAQAFPYRFLIHGTKTQPNGQRVILVPATYAELVKEVGKEVARGPCELSYLQWWRWWKGKASRQIWPASGQNPQLPFYAYRRGTVKEEHESSQLKSAMQKLGHTSTKTTTQYYRTKDTYTISSLEGRPEAQTRGGLWFDRDLPEKQK